MEKFTRKMIFRQRTSRVNSSLEWAVLVSLFFFYFQATSAPTFLNVDKKVSELNEKFEAFVRDFKDKMYLNKLVARWADDEEQSSKPKYLFCAKPSDEWFFSSRLFF